jgi:hypothetical protein
MHAEEQACEAVRINRAIARCLSYLGRELPSQKQGDFMLLLGDMQNKNMRLENSLYLIASDRGISQRG